MLPQSIESVLGRFAGQRVAVVGDLMLDRYIWGKASRISQEAPVPIVAVERLSAVPGGAANVLRNLATLGAQPSVFGVVGDDPVGDELCDLIAAHGATMDGLVRAINRKTTEKTRIIAGVQQVVRVDTEETAPLDGTAAAEVLSRALDALERNAVDAVIIEDYAKGLVNRSLVEGIAHAARERGIPVALDPHPGNAHNVKGLTVITPNRTEAFALAGSYPMEGPSDILADTALLGVVETLEARWAPENLLVTLGPLGMALFQPERPPLHIPTRAREVFDVSGAGDTVIATFTLALAAGASSDDAAVIANHAAGVVVGKVGTSPIGFDELVASFYEEAL